jgi:hypothetical protein
VECIVGFFALFIGIAVIVGFIQNENDKDIDHRITIALNKLDSGEFSRLSAIKRDRELRRQQSQFIAQENQRYLEAIFVLDAAEQGVFFPDGGEVFYRLDDNYNNDTSNNENNYYDDDDGYAGEDYFSEEAYYDYLAELHGYGYKL